MQKIKIHEFGPLKDLELQIKDLIVFIGPQASGKSTISKSVYFFKSLRDDLIKYFFECIEKNIFQKHMGNYSKIIRNKFIQFWGPSYHMNNIHLQYFFSDEIHLTLSLKGKYPDPKFSEKFQEIILSLAHEIQAFSEKIARRNPTFTSASDYIAFENEKKNYLKKIETDIYNLFSDNRDLLYIPAGRSLLTTLSDQLQSIHPYKLDFLMRVFIDRINFSKPYFSKSMSEIVQDRKMLTYEKIETENVNMAKSIIENILKAKYRFDSEGEKLFYDSSRYVKINFASSGQQESVWILLLIFLQILEKKKSLIVFEEPEAHLYPEAQQQIIDLISLLFNTSDNEIIITTHSPYILSALNNLLYAGKLGSIAAHEVSDIISDKIWLKPEDAQAFFIEQGQLINIIDNETGLIKTEAIDSASNLINEVYYKLFNLDE